MKTLKAAMLGAVMMLGTTVVAAPPSTAAVQGFAWVRFSEDTGIYSWAWCNNRVNTYWKVIYPSYGLKCLPGPYKDTYRIYKWTNLG